MTTLELRARPKRKARPKTLEEKLQEFVSEHRELKDEPLQLAVWYEPPRGGKHIHLFEIASNFVSELVDPDKKMFLVSYGSTPGFPLDEDQELRLLLTSPTEWKHAVEKNWSAVRLLRGVKARGKFRILFATAEGKRLWKRL